MLLEMHHISKRYSGVLALDNVAFSLEPGSVHCLLGENGAGKSTLIKILSGAIGKDSGEILLVGKPATIDSPSTAQRLGISTIYQDFKLVPELSVAENIMLGNEPTTLLQLIDYSAMNNRASALLRQLGEEIDPTEPVRKLSMARQQVVEIAKALSRNVRILILDEPTAPLTDRETDILFGIIRKLKTDGVGVIYISHRLEEVFKIGDRLSVLRDGKNVGTYRVDEVDRPMLIRLMVGRPLEDEFPHAELARSEEILRVEGLGSHSVHNVSFSLQKGEILGLAGLVGAGRTELARILFGADQAHQGTMLLEGKKILPRSPQKAIEAGIGLLTEDRNSQGLFLQMNVRENISAANLDSLCTGPFVRRKDEDAVAKRYINRLQVKTPDSETCVETLSGGNRQKVVLARWLFADSKVLIFDEPTVGIDVGVKYEIYELINDLAKNGVGVIVISSDMPELLGICTRIAVMCEGRITGFLTREEATQEKIMELATAFADEAA
ncbi:MAG: sugar ABC transporter ATP-binding protein [Bacteroidota bacterium]